jgi:hypothetical protein
MALVKNLESVTKERNSVHGPVDCAYTIFAANDGKRYLQLDTFGSRSRKIAGKISQSMQFDEDLAHQLVRIINEELLR